MKPAKTDPYDYSPVILYASEQAIKTGKDWCVASSGGMWRATSIQPGCMWSHWKVDRLGELTAHLGGANVKEHRYEKLGE